MMEIGANPSKPTTDTVARKDRVHCERFLEQVRQYITFCQVFNPSKWDVDTIPKNPEETFKKWKERFELVMYSTEVRTFIREEKKTNFKTFVFAILRWSRPGRADQYLSDKSIATVINAGGSWQKQCYTIFLDHGVVGKPPDECTAAKIVRPTSYVGLITEIKFNALNKQLGQTGGSLIFQ